MVFAGSFLFGGKESPRLESNPHLIAHVAIQNHVCFSLQNDVQCTFDSGQLRRINHQRPGFNEHHLKHQRLHPLAAAEAYHLHPTVDGRIPKGIPSLLTRIPKQDRHIQTRSTAASRSKRKILSSVDYSTTTPPPQTSTIVAPRSRQRIFWNNDCNVTTPFRQNDNVTNKNHHPSYLCTSGG